MGLDCTVRFPGAVPTWDTIRSQLARVGEPAPLRMIDGLPAFPDESPAADWRELRIGAGGGMVTLRRSSDSLTCIVWGNADPALLAARDRIIWACAAAGAGLIETPTGSLSSEQFAQVASIHPA
ncbi:MAG: hypothetical protein L0241_22465 [Planctomycetia bacterium]|nr:hypothetical protein [Planctomycetia bacterium]